MFLANLGLSGLGAILYTAKDLVGGLTKFYVAHVLSNLNIVVYGFSLYTIVAGGFGWGYAVMYAIYAMAAYYFESNNGARLLRVLDPDHPYLDASLQPSIFYILGLAQHTEAYSYESAKSDVEEAGDDITVTF